MPSFYFCKKFHSSCFCGYNNIKNLKGSFAMKTITNEIVKRFELYLYEEEKSDNTIEKYMRDIRFFREWLSGQGVDKSVVLAYKKELCRMLTEYVKTNNITNGPLFVTKTGKPIDRSTVWKMMKALCESAKVSKNKVFPHNLRHLFARTFYTLQKDIVRLADILGHSSVNTTRIYTIENGSTHRRQMQRMGLVRMQN